MPSHTTLLPVDTKVSFYTEHNLKIIIILEYNISF